MYYHFDDFRRKFPILHFVTDDAILRQILIILKLKLVFPYRQLHSRSSGQMERDFHRIATCASPSK